MSWTVTLNGNTYTEASFEGFNYANESTGLPASLRDFVFHARDVLKSSVSGTINLSTLVVSNTLSITAEVDKFFELNQSILLYSSTVPTDFVYGTVTAYTSSTGALELTIKEIDGTASYSNWVAVLGLGKDSQAAAASAAAAASSETNASTSETNAENAETAAALTYTNFDARWLGDKAVDPTLDNTGAALVEGSAYYNSIINKTKLYNGVSWSPIQDGIAEVSADTSPQLGGNLDTQAFTVSGRDLVADGVKLDGISNDITTELNSIRANVALNSFNTAVNGGMSVHSMVDGVADTLTDSTGIDLSRSVNTVYDNDNTLIHPIGTGFGLSEGATYNTSHDLSPQDSITAGIAFNEDGTKFFVLGDSNDRLFEYTCSVGFDLDSTVAYSGNSQYIGGQVSNPRCVIFNTDGTKFFVLDGSSYKVYEYTCSVGFSLSSTILYPGNNITVPTFTKSIAFNDVGTKLYTGIGTVVSTIQEYSVSTPFSLGSTITSTGSTFNAGTQAASDLQGIVFSAEGDKLFVLTDNSNNTLYEYTLASNFDLGSTVTYTGYSYNTQTNTVPTSIAFSPVGDKFFIVGDGLERIYGYTSIGFTVTGNMSLHTEAVTALSTPDSVLVVLQEEDTGNITINTDITAWVSRNVPINYTTDFSADSRLIASSHGFANNTRVILSSATGTGFPGGSYGNIVYYVTNTLTNSFELSLTSGGPGITLTSNGSGTKNIGEYSYALLVDESGGTSNRILVGTTDLSSQNTGTEVTTVIISDNLKNFDIHALSTQWV